MEKRAMHWRWRAGSGGARPRRVELLRRGIHHGSLEPLAPPPAAPEDLERNYRLGEPILLRGWLAVDSKRARARIEATRRWLERLRAGEDFAGGVRERLARRRKGSPVARVTGTSVDLADPREIEKVHCELAVKGPAGKELYAKLSWIAEDDSDESLRVRFSFGNERASDWRRDEKRAACADRLAELVFPECELLSRHRALFALLEGLCDAPVRLSERIVYNNAPGGGASFHHDAEPGQLGVVYGQMSGSTGWLALSRHRLAIELAAASARTPLARRVGTPAKADRALEDPKLPALERLLNHDPRLTRRLVEAGAFYRLEPGDVLILPSPSRQACAWHSVFALGKRPSVAHSHGLFLAR